MIEFNIEEELFGEITLDNLIEVKFSEEILKKNHQIFIKLFKSIGFSMKNQNKCINENAKQITDLKGEVNWLKDQNVSLNNEM